MYSCPAMTAYGEKQADVPQPSTLVPWTPAVIFFMVVDLNGDGLMILA